MSSEITLWDQSVSPVQIAFNWDEIVAETKRLVKRDAELTATIDDAMVERFRVRVKIGFNLMALQEEHSRLGGGKGDFTTHILPELGIDERSSQRYTSVARLEQNMNPTRVSGSDLFDLPMPMNTWYKLASPSGQPVVRQLESGEINPTREDITKALEDLAEERKRNKELKQELEAKEKEVETNEQAHIALVQSLEQKLEEKPEPEKVIEYQDTLETAAKVATLEAQIKALEAKPDITPEKQQELDKLQLNLKNAQTELDFYTTQNKALADKNKQLSEESRRSFEEITAIAGRLRIRQEWQFATSEVQAAIRKFLTRIPSEIDRESFEGEENTRTAQTIDLLIETATLLKKSLLGSDSTVDADEPHTEQVPMLTVLGLPSVVIGIPPEYQALFDEYEQALLNSTKDLEEWATNEEGYIWQSMSAEKHIGFTRELLSSRVDRRIRAALSAMKIALGMEAVRYA